MKIQSLPIEILSLCTQYLSLKDQRTSRLVSTAFENAIVNNALTVSIDRQPSLNPLRSQTVPYAHLKEICPKGVCLQTLQGHTRWVQSVAFSPDGKSIATGSSDRTIKIWDAETGEHRQTLQGHTANVWSVAFNPDGKSIATGSSDQTIKIWDAETAECRQTLQGHTYIVSSVAFSPEGKSIATGSWDKIVKIWDAETGACRQTLQVYAHAVLSVAFSPNGKSIATGSSDQNIKIWDAETGACRQTLQGHTDAVCSVAFSPDGKIIATGSSDQNIKIWDAETGGCLQTLQGHTSIVESVAFSPDGKSIATGSADLAIKIWDAETGECRQTLQGHTSTVRSVAFSLDGKSIATGSYDNTIKIWSLDPTPEEKLISVILGNSNCTILPEKLRNLDNAELIKYAIQFITDSNFQAIRNQFEDGRGSVFLESNLIFQYVKRIKAMPPKLSSQVLSLFLDKTIPFLEDTERGSSGYLVYPNLTETLKYLKTEQQQLLISEPCPFAEES